MDSSGRDAVNSVLDRTKQALADFERKEIKIGGVSTVVYSAGVGSPLVYLHGSGTFPGFGFAKNWLRSHRVIIPYHPGFGESDDDSRIDSINDYVLHYLDLFDALELEKLSLVGSSLGGWIASEIAVVQPARIEKLVLVGPTGLIIDSVPSTDLYTVHPRDLLSYLVADQSVLKPFLPEGHDLDFMTLRYKETTSTARLNWERSGNPKLGQWLHRISCETLLLWGELDRIKPVKQSDVWSALIPNARIEVLKGVGHLPLDETPEAATKLISDFLKEKPRFKSAAESLAKRAS
jgi:pimeloyl-ACP methyl ester carboxylesterase